MASVLGYTGRAIRSRLGVPLGRYCVWTLQPRAQLLLLHQEGRVEIALGSALILSRQHRTTVGWVAAAFFAAVYPGNISQVVNRIDSLGLDSDLKRWIRMPLQPALIAWALWSTGAWQAARRTGS
ncbi:hypothetical protein [Salinibacterium xinjiangense]|uniref:hypothetical protein n=1 Tax=Salinibacterium xinjiangense TaxID=386302 RepID=UPI001C536399|nr:hypothetical protein [Salinibacterium xinjiangense]